MNSPAGLSSTTNNDKNESPLLRSASGSPLLRSVSNDRDSEVTTSEGRATRSRQRSPEITTRDMRALQWMGEQYGARYDLLSVLLGRLSSASDGGPLSESGVRAQVARWRRMGLVTTERLLGHMWVLPTARGLARAGVSYPTWQAPATRLDHVHAVGTVRLHFERKRRAAESTWVSERALLSERGQATWHVFDGLLDPLDSAAPVWGIEVELTPKTRKRYSEEVFSSIRPGTSGVVYFCPPDRLERIRADVTAAFQAHLGLGLRLDFLPLPALASGARSAVP